MSDYSTQNNKPSNGQISAERLENIANSVPGALLQYKLNEDGTDELLYISDQTESLWGLTRDEALADVSKTWALIVPEDVPDMQASVMKSFTDLSFWDHTWRIELDGKIKWLNGRGVPKKQPDGSVIWDTLILDVTREKETEAQLEEANRQLELAVETTQLGIWTVDMSTNVMDSNARNAAIFDIELHETNPAIWTEKVHPADIERVNKEFEKVFAGEKIHNLRFRVQLPNNGTRYIQTSAAPLVQTQGTVTKLLGINTDITGFIQKEEELQKTIETKNTLFRELHHRIKNNLNLISNLLFLKSRTTENKVLLDFIAETKNRIYSIAKTHDQLLSLEELDQLYVKDYLEELIPAIIETYSIDKSLYPLDLKLENQKMSVDKIFILGLLINEMLSNTIKYAYPPEDGGPIIIQFTKHENALRVYYSDKGRGYEPSASEDSIGLSLISMLTDQLDAKLISNSNNGVTYDMTIPLP